MPDPTDPEPPFDTQAFIDALSQARFDRYLGFADGDQQRAVELYSANVGLSQAFYVPLHAVEIALRNRINDCLAPAHGERWFDRDAFKKLDHQGDQLEELYERLAAQKLDPSPGQVVSGLTFGYWTQLLSSTYDELWQTELKEIARDDRGKRMSRKALHVPLTNLRNLRNRIAHYEPIITWDLGKRHAMAVARHLPVGPDPRYVPREVRTPSGRRAAGPRRREGSTGGPQGWQRGVDPTP